MFHWYERARVCYAYLADVSASDVSRNSDSEFAKSQWFTRGWTLQELIAPANVVFMSRDWIEIGTKSSLCISLAEITTVDVKVLNGRKSPQATSIAQRMSWASKRETTRKEDIAYCLMGLFGVNMPLLYGEEDRAFIRLQEELIKDSDDHSLFAWIDQSAAPHDAYGLFAKSPAYFAKSSNILPYRDLPQALVDDIKKLVESSSFATDGFIAHFLDTLRAPPYSMSNKGLHIDLPLGSLPQQGLYLAALNCTDRMGASLCIYLQKMPRGINQYARVKAHTLDIEPFDSFSVKREASTVYVRQNISNADLED